MKTILLFALLAAPLWPQVFSNSNARRIQGRNVDAPLNPTDGSTLVWSTAAQEYQVSTGAIGGVANPSNTFSAAATTVTVTDNLNSTAKVGLCYTGTAPNYFALLYDSIQINLNTTVFTFPAAVADGKCVVNGTGGGSTSGSGTTGKLSKWTSSTALGDSIVSESGAILTIVNTLSVPTIIGSTAVGGSLTIQSTSAAGTTDSIVFKRGNNGGTTALLIDSTGLVTGTSNILPTDNGATLGDGTHRFSTIYGINIVQGSGTWFINGNVKVDSGVGDGILRLTNAASNNFARLQGGGITSSFPALSRDGAGWRVTTADSNTAYSFIGASQYRAPLTTPASATATCVAGTALWDADFVYICVATDTLKRVAIATW